MNLTLGQIVRSKAGRDGGKLFIIVEILDQSYVMLSDGNLRRVEKPKKKKAKHLEIAGDVIETINSKLINNIRVSNADIRKSLAEVISVKKEGTADADG